MSAPRVVLVAVGMLFASFSTAQALTATSTTVAGSPNVSFIGQSVTFTATVSGSGGTPTGTVTFKDTTTNQTIGTPQSLSGGQASVSTSALAIGNHTIQASYNGDSTFAASAGVTFQEVTKAASSTGVTGSPNPSTPGQSVTFTATVSAAGGATGTPTGTVTFTDNTTSTTLGTSTLSGGRATVTTSMLAIGNHTIVASYGGDATFDISINSTLQQVAKLASTTSVTGSPNPSLLGQSVAFTATVTGTGGTPTGTVTFTDETTSTTLGTITLSAGKATVTTSTLTIGNHLVLASYNGDSTFDTSSNSVLQQVSKRGTTTAVTAAPNPSTSGQSVTFTATVSGTGGTPTGTVTFMDLNTSQTLGTSTLSGGIAILSTSILAVGNHLILASYNGDSTFDISSNSVLQQVNSASASTISVVGSPNPSFVGQSVTFTATVSASGGTPTGAVTFTDSTTSQTLGTITLSGGVASVTTSTLTVGNHTILASYSGDGTFNASSNSTVQQVTKDASNIAVVGSPNPSQLGQSVTFTATVSAAAGATGTPSGTVTFTDNSTSQTLGTITLSGGVATVTTSMLAIGNHTILASYNGDSNFSGSSNSVLQQVGKDASATMVVGSPNPSIPGQAVTFTATVTAAGGATGTPTGTVTFTDNSTSQTLGTITLSGGVATVTTSMLAIGNHVILASYSGDGTFNASSNSVLQQVSKVSTTTAVTAARGLIFSPTAFPGAPAATSSARAGW